MLKWGPLEGSIMKYLTRNWKPGTIPTKPKVILGRKLRQSKTKQKCTLA